MMRDFVNSPEVASRILAIAATWEGTPYIGDGALRGTGCSCAALPYEILIEAGMRIPLPPPRGVTRRSELMGFMRGVIESHEGVHFRRLVENEPHQVGDLFLFNAGMGHLGICLGNGNVIHSLQRTGARTEKYLASKDTERLVAAWRPIVAE